MVKLPGSLLSDLRAAEERANRELAAACCPPATPEARLGVPFAPGQVVLDLVTGEKVEVVSGTRTNYLVPPAGGTGPAGGAGPAA